VRCAKTTIFLAIVLADATATLAQDHVTGHIISAGSSPFNSVPISQDLTGLAGGV
jgi:hypothetical protein